MVAEIMLLQEELPVGTRHFMVTKLAVAFFLNSTKIDELR
jgi:hypothetical protein